jgi:hypothetical protein
VIGTILWAILLSASPSHAQEAGPVAGGVVSSKEWTVHRSSTDKTEEFSGDVRYRTGATVLNADWALYTHSTQYWDVKGDVRVNHKLEAGDVLEAQGDRARFNQQDQKGDLTGREGVRFTRTPAEGDWDYGSSKRLEWEGRDRAAAAGAVHLWGPRLESWSDRTDYYHGMDDLKMTGGRPVVLKLAAFDDSNSDWLGAVQGDEITITKEPRTLTAEGKARGWLDFTDSAAKQARPTP